MECSLLQAARADGHACAAAPSHSHQLLTRERGGISPQQVHITTRGACRICARDQTRGSPPATPPQRVLPTSRRRDVRHQVRGPRSQACDSRTTLVMSLTLRPQIVFRTASSCCRPDWRSARRTRPYIAYPGTRQGGGSSSCLSRPCGGRCRVFFSWTRGS